MLCAIMYNLTIEKNKNSKINCARRRIKPLLVTPRYVKISPEEAVKLSFENPRIGVRPWLCGGTPL